MLIAPFLLKGIAALKSIFFLTSGASVSWYSQHMGKRTIGPGLFAVSLALSCALIHTLPYEPPLELGSIPESPPLDSVLWQSLSDISVEFNMGSDSLVVSNPDVGLSESSTRSYAPGVTPGVQYSVVPLILAPSHEPAVRVPELNWNIPGAPTIQAPKPVEQPAVVTYNFYIVEVSWGSPHRPGDPGPRGPTGPDESIPPLRKYEAPPLMFTRRCGKKSPLPQVGDRVGQILVAVRAAFVLAHTAQMLYFLLPLPWYIAWGWRICRNAHRRSRLAIAHHQAEYHRLHNGR